MITPDLRVAWWTALLSTTAGVPAEPKLPPLRQMAKCLGRIRTARRVRKNPLRFSRLQCRHRHLRALDNNVLAAIFHSPCAESSNLFLRSIIKFD